MANIVLQIAYDGTRYMGWQNTGSYPNIESELEKLLEQILQHPITLQAASRTDRGVHADAQVINFHTPKEALDLPKLQYSLNRLLPDDIRILALFEAPTPTFHATLDATKKEYSYRIVYSKTLMPFYRFTHWHFPYALDIALMKKAGAFFLGEHDFVAFKNRKKEKKVRPTTRTLYDIEIESLEEERLLIRITGNNFLYKMMRNIVGTLAYVGCGKITLEALQKILENGIRADAGITAPACGLTLHKVYYERASFPQSYTPQDL